MTIETFKWCVQIQGGAGQVSASNNMRSAQFGNGFIQSASSGFNTRRRSLDLIHGSRKEWRSVYDFLNAHVVKPFILTPPDGVPGVFIVSPDSVTLKPVGGGVFEVKATVEERFSSAQ